MYFLSEEERQLLARVYLPQSREAGVAEELRGWNWDEPPLQPVYSVPLGVSDVMGNYCPKGRDLYFRRVERRQGQPTYPMLEGKLFHELLAVMITWSKRFIYTNSVEGIYSFPQQVQEECLKWFENRLQAEGLASLNGEKEKIVEKGKALIRFEVERIWARIQEVLIQQAYIKEDSLVATSIPVVVEQKLNGSFLGLSGKLSTDALTYAEPIVVDLKFGPRRDFYRLATTGYALVLEALSNFPVNIGCIVYAEYKQGRWQIERDLHIISDELRQRFIEERDEKMRQVYEEIDPGPEMNCKIECAYSMECVG